MIIINLKGGLGNQMFQYAVGRNLAVIHGTELKLDTSFLLKRNNEAITYRDYELSIFNIAENFASSDEIGEVKNFWNKALLKIIPSYKNNPYVKEKHFHFDPHVLKRKDNCYLDGHWISERYFEGIKSIIRNEFSFKLDVIESARDLKFKIQNSNAICIQIRRGDYVTNADVSKVHGVTSLTYFSKAIDLIKTNVENPVFFIFSDDIDWCIENFKDLKSAYFVEKILAGASVSNSDYLQLMKECKYFIISNSTFGWWGAWLGDYRNKIVIAPKAWLNVDSIITKDVYPSEWIKI
jgi:hypothetical protein